MGLSNRVGQSCRFTIFEDRDAVRTREWHENATPVAWSPLRACFSALQITFVRATDLKCRILCHTHTLNEYGASSIFLPMLERFNASDPLSIVSATCQYFLSPFSVVCIPSRF